MSPPSFQRPGDDLAVLALETRHPEHLRLPERVPRRHLRDELLPGHVATYPESRVAIAVGGRAPSSRRVVLVEGGVPPAQVVGEARCRHVEVEAARVARRCRCRSRGRRPAGSGASVPAGTARRPSRNVNVNSPSTTRNAVAVPGMDVRAAPRSRAAVLELRHRELVGVARAGSLGGPGRSVMVSPSSPPARRTTTRPGSPVAYSGGGCWSNASARGQRSLRPWRSRTKRRAPPARGGRGSAGSSPVTAKVCTTSGGTNAQVSAPTDARRSSSLSVSSPSSTKKHSRVARVDVERRSRRRLAAARDLDDAHLLDRLRAA